MKKLLLGLAIVCVAVSAVASGTNWWYVIIGYTSPSIDKRWTKEMYRKKVGDPKDVNITNCPTLYHVPSGQYAKMFSIDNNRYDLNYTAATNAMANNLTRPKRQMNLTRPKRQMILRGLQAVYDAGFVYTNSP